MFGPQFGEENFQAKLRERDVRAIRQWRAMGELERVIADHYEIATATVSGIVLGKRWSHLPMRPYRCPRLRARTKRDARIRALRRRGLGVAEISRRLSVPLATVSRVARAV